MPSLRVVLQLLYPTPPSILTLETWVQRTQALPSANYARRLAIGQTKSYSVQPRLPLAATIGPAGRSRVFFYLVRPASLMLGPDYTAPSYPQLLYGNFCKKKAKNGWQKYSKNADVIKYLLPSNIADQQNCQQYC